MANLYRTQLLLEAEQHRALADIAQREGRSISEIVREIVAQYLVEQEQEERARREIEALEELTRIRKSLQEQYGLYQGNPLDDVRTEREAEMERVWRGEA